MSSANRKRQRRKILKAIGSGAVLSSLYGVSGCSGEKEPAAVTPRSEPAPAPTTSSPTVNDAADAVAESADATSLTPLAEDDPQAKALAYVDDAGDVDSDKFFQYQPGQICENCALYLGADGSAQGACSIFPGKSVQASGWCSVYAPKA